MNSIRVAIVLILILTIVYFYRSFKNTEYMDDIPINTMNDADIDKLRSYIEHAVRINQQYGDFRRQYPYSVSTWQFFKMIATRKRGELTNASLKDILIQSGAMAKTGAVVSMSA